jgi:hypothetical protein
MTIHEQALHKIRNLRGTDIFTAVDVACEALGMDSPKPYRVACLTCGWQGGNLETIFMPDNVEELRCPKCFARAE